MFANKPLLVVLNKTDLRPVDQLNPAERALLQALTEHPNTEIVPMSNMTEDGVSYVKELACDKLLKMRAESKLQGKKINEITNRIHVSMPQPRDNLVSTSLLRNFGESGSSTSAPLHALEDFSNLISLLSPFYKQY